MLTSQYLTILTEEHLHEEWDEKKWIGVGETILPLAKCQQLSKQDTIPSPKMSITDLLKTKLVKKKIEAI